MPNVVVNEVYKQAPSNNAPLEVSALIFTDTDSGLTQGHLVAQTAATLDAVAAGAALGNTGLSMVGYVPGRGAVFVALNLASGFILYTLPLGPDETTLPASTFSKTSVVATAKQILGLDADGVYVASSSAPGVIYRYGFDGQESTVVLGGYNLTRGGTCPLLWRGPTGFRAFVQAGTGFTSAQRGATTEFNFVPGDTVNTSLDSSRFTASAGANRGPEFSGFFYGYQPLCGGGGAAYVDPTIGGLPAISYSGVDNSGGQLLSVSTSSNTLKTLAQRLTTVRSGTTYTQDHVDVGEAFELAPLMDTIGADQRAGVMGYVGVMPPYSGPAEEFWTDIVYALEII